jgi:hypothetical protein
LDEDVPRPPVVGRPDFFDEDEGPIGAFQAPIIQAVPRELQVEDPLTLTIRVVASGPVHRPPRQLRLENYPEFKEQFYIQYPDGPTFRRLDDRTWELTCVLKPKSTNVKAIPSFPFVFFTPGFLPPQRGYQVQRTASIDITVRRRSSVQDRDVKSPVEPIRAPASAYQLAEGPRVLRRVSAPSVDALLVVGTISLALPPLIAASWCVMWRRLHPDAVRRARRRRSQAARTALVALRSVGGSDEELVRRTADIVTSYLRQRFDLSAEEPTPAEVGAHLESVQGDPELASQAAEFFRSCDAARFGHFSAAGFEELTELARQLILNLEAEPCPSSASS